MATPLTPTTDLASVNAEMLPLIRQLGRGRYAITIGGSRGKGLADHRSDVDYRLFCEEALPAGPEKDATWATFNAAVARWRERGVEIDGCWVRLIGKVDGDLEEWLAGRARPIETVWTMWGYHMPTDIYNMQVVEDPFGVVAGWKARLAHYPAALKKAVLDRHLKSLRYWRVDYHYVNKVERGDPVFCAALASRLVHDLLQVIFALNEVYWVGDGANLEFVQPMAVQPPRLADRVREALYPVPGPELFARQRETLVALINDVEQLVESGREEPDGH